MNIPIRNEEHFEAAQLDTNLKRENFIKSLPVEDQNKFYAVEKAAKLLMNNNVQFYLFPLLPCLYNKEKSFVWQWNSLSTLIKYNEAGRPIHNELVGIINQGLIYAIYNLFIPIMEGDIIDEKIMNFINLFRHLVIIVINI